MPASASAHSTPLPTEKTRDCTAPPTSPVAGSKPRIEKVATGSQGRDDFDLSCALEKTTKIRTTAINKNSLLCIGEPPIIDLTTKAQRTQRRINHVVFLCVLCAFVVKKNQLKPLIEMSMFLRLGVASSSAVVSNAQCTMRS